MKVRGPENPKEEQIFVLANKNQLVTEPRTRLNGGIGSEHESVIQLEKVGFDIWSN